MVDARQPQMKRRTAMGIVGFFALLGAALPKRLARTLGRTKEYAVARTRGAARPQPAGPAVRAYFGELREGARVGDATILALHDVHLGAIPVVLRLASGRSVQVDVVRRGSAGEGGDASRAEISATPRTALHLVNRADGAVPTHEPAGLATMALGAALARREAQGAVPPALLTHEERELRFPGGRFHV